MRLLALAGSVSLVLTPLDADACTQIVGIFGVVPDGVPMPANGRLFAGISPSSSYTVTAQRLDAAGPVALPVQVVGPNHVAVELSGLTAGAQVEVAMPGFQSEQTLTIASVLPADHVAPAPPSDLQFEVRYMPFTRCFGPALIIEGTMTPGTDDVGVVGHVLSRVFEDGSEETFGIELINTPPHADPGALNLFVEGAPEPAPDEAFCFALRTIDRAGNLSMPLIAGDCAFVPMRDGGVRDATIDAGYPDSGLDRDGGVAPRDAGPRDGGVRDSGLALPDAGGPAPDSGVLGGGPLDETGAACGCATTEAPRSSALAVLWVWTALALARRKRTTRR